MVIDPICRLTVDKSTERRAYFNGATVYFCSEHCRERFVSAPDAEKQRRTHQGSGAHTCTRHPELWQEDPCECPKCRIALDPMVKSAESDGMGESNSHRLTAHLRTARAIASQVMSGLCAVTTVHLNRFINPPAKSVLNVRKGLATTTPSAQ